MVAAKFVTFRRSCGSNRHYTCDVPLQNTRNAHDRFIIIDKNIVYHFGASLKDLGRKWFAFSKMDIGAMEMLARVEKMV
jgi:hypothetical protein